MTNPWNLTAAESRTLAAMAEHGHVKLVSAAHEVSEDAIYRRLRNASKKMGGHPTILMVVVYDRWQREQAVS